MTETLNRQLRQRLVRGAGVLLPGAANALAARLIVASGFEAVPSPKILAIVQLTGGIRTEPVLARGRVYVATTAGRLYALEP